MNENSNGLFLQYFSKKMKLTDITDEQVLATVENLNHRPRKVIGFRTPYEVFFGLEMRYTRQSAVVALRT